LCPFEEGTIECDEHGGHNRAEDGNEGQAAGERPAGGKESLHLLLQPNG
jgi:hypothetical protein